MDCWLQIDPEEFITTVPLTTPQPSTDEHPIADYSAKEITEALNSGHLNADQALWLHTYNFSWEITK